MVHKNYIYFGYPAAKPLSSSGQPAVNHKFFGWYSLHTSARHCACVISIKRMSQFHCSFPVGQTVTIVFWTCKEQNKYKNNSQAVCLPDCCAQSIREETRDWKLEKQFSKRPRASKPTVSKFVLTPHMRAVAQADDSPICASALNVCEKITTTMFHVLANCTYKMDNRSLEIYSSELNLDREHGISIVERHEQCSFWVTVPKPAFVKVTYSFS